MTKIQWTAEVWAQVDAMGAEGLRRKQIAAVLDCPTSALNTAIERREIRTGRADLWTAEKIARLRELWAEGGSIAEIGRRMGISKNSVGSKAHRLGLPLREIKSAAVSAPARYPAEPRKAVFIPWGVAAAERRARSAQKRAAMPHYAPAGPLRAPLAAGHPVTWGLLQALLSPEHREAWPERPAGGALAVSCLSGVSRYAEKPKAHQRPKNPGLMETWAMLGERRAA